MSTSLRFTSRTPLNFKRSFNIGRIGINHHQNYFPSNRISSISWQHIARLASQGFQDYESHYDEGDPVFSHLEKGKSLSEFSTWGIGGPAKFFIQVDGEDLLCDVLRFCREQSLRLFFLGKGSNCLFDDQGFDGCVILNCIRFLEEIDDGLFRVGSGYPFNTLGVEMAKRGFSGLEFAGGIPGTVGGAVFMNAGAQSQETFQVLHAVEVVTLEGEKKVYLKEKGELPYGYRSSPFQKNLGKEFITAATFKLKASQNSRSNQLAYMEKRRNSQPLLEKTAGCVFRNPEIDGLAAAKIIDDIGLKGLTVGGAQVSPIHANFLVNTGKSTCENMLELISNVKDVVARRTGIELREEILYVPYDQPVGSHRSEFL